MKPKLTLALVALITSSAFAGIPKVLPEFKNEKQLAEWRAEMAAKAESEPSKLDVRSSTLDVPPAFYTGKPYIQSTGSYAFKYRSYNPELARWTSEDPSGFPDGANGSIYAPTPTTGMDPLGLNELYPMTDLRVVRAVVTGWESSGHIFSARLANHSLDQLDDRDAEQDEINAMQQADAFTDIFKLSWWDQHYGVQGDGSYSWQETINFGSDFGSDLHLAYGHVTFEFTVGVTSYGNQGRHKYDVNFNFTDTYNFNPHTHVPGFPNAGINPIRAFDALQQAGIATIYDSTGSFNKIYE